tara:strand:+ start:1569 stop:1946 length:378 start_codon:yes stop_codon:yes gene_type:complete
MKRFAQFIFFLVPLSILAQEKGALISFETDTIDYGEILKGSNGVRTFTFENIGDVPIEIQGVKSSCGCTVPKKPNAPVPPGGKGEIQVKYDTNRIGVFRKTITVNTNAPSSPIIALKIKGNVLAK